MTIGEWQASNADLPRIERELLLTDVLSVTKAYLLTHPDHEVNDSHVEKLNRVAHQLREGQPWAYLAGNQEFRGIDLKVTPDVLIPRPETELLVELAIEYAPTSARVLELGTGSGAIAIALSSERPDLVITATDISPAALEIARENTRVHGLDIEYIESDWLTSIPTPTDGWDVIISNPPYVAEGDSHLAALQFEPQHALVSGPAGLSDLQAIVTEAVCHLRACGRLFLEHGWDQAGSVQAMMKQNGMTEIKTHQDLAGLDRVTSGAAQRVTE